MFKILIRKQKKAFIKVGLGFNLVLTQYKIVRNSQSNKDGKLYRLFIIGFYRWENCSGGHKKIVYQQYGGNKHFSESSFQWAWLFFHIVMRICIQFIVDKKLKAIWIGPVWVSSL